jgi:hypothetical protein
VKDLIRLTSALSGGTLLIDILRTQRSEETEPSSSEAPSLYTRSGRKYSSDWPNVRKHTLRVFIPRTLRSSSRVTEKSVMSNGLMEAFVLGRKSNIRLLAQQALSSLNTSLSDLLPRRYPTSWVLLLRRHANMSRIETIAVRSSPRRRLMLKSWHAMALTVPYRRRKPKAEKGHCTAGCASSDVPPPFVQLVRRI